MRFSDWLDGDSYETDRTIVLRSIDEVHFKFC
jgi:hypothetical protein